MPDPRADFQHLAIWLAACTDDNLYEALLSRCPDEDQEQLLADCGLLLGRCDRRLLLNVLEGKEKGYEEVPSLLARIRGAFRRSVTLESDAENDLINGDGEYSGPGCTRRAQFKLISLRDQSVAEWRAFQELDDENLGA